MKRFWESAAAAADAEGFTIELDGKAMRLPGGAVLRVGNRAMAEAIAAEWQAAGGGKGGEMTAADVPLTQLAGTAQERIAPDPAATADAIARYAETDLLCYRAEHPAPLVAHQAHEWQPWLDWLEHEHGAKLIPTVGIAHVAQPPESLAAIRARLRSESAPVLAALGVAVPALGSVVLGLALAEGAVGPSRAFELAALDELFQVERWGEDEWAAKRRRDIASDIALAHRFLVLARAA
ncbi:MAG: ATP12 family protein [Acetobacteraceae bacterium]|nr:ATP12 family protein [Acetobacteraceae bacterium]